MSTDEKEVPNEGITIEQLAKMRESMLSMYQKNYKNFIQSIKEMPLPDMFMHQPMFFFDSATLWMKEIIQNAPIVQKNQEQTEKTVQ